jgi:hypothetical protein
MTTISKQSLQFCGLLLFCCNFFRPANAFVFPEKRCHRCQKSTERIAFASTLLAGSTPESNSEKPENDDGKDDDPVEEYLAMEEASRRVTRRLMLPRMIFSSIGESIRLFAYAFLILSFALNVAGYAWVNDGEGLRIGTLEERNFQMEIQKSMKEK